MLTTTTNKTIHSLKYFTGAHPQIRSQIKGANRPTEFGNKVWATSLILIDYLHEKPFELNGLRVLEIGCGWGLIGVYLAKEFACDVTCSDLDEHVLPIVKIHADENNVSVKTKKASFNDLSTEYLKNFDLIIGAEVCYSEEVANQLICLTKRTQQAKTKYFVIADPGRPDFDTCADYCKSVAKSTLSIRTGSVNGKSTQILTTLFN